jgi:hypothetical protein
MGINNENFKINLGWVRTSWQNTCSINHGT